MATAPTKLNLVRLIDLEINEGALVDEGDNPLAKIALFKMKQAKPKGWLQRNINMPNIPFFGKGKVGKLGDDPTVGLTLADLLPTLTDALEPEQLAWLMGQLQAAPPPPPAPTEVAAVEADKGEGDADADKAGHTPEDDEDKAAEKATEKVAAAEARVEKLKTDKAFAVMSKQIDALKLEVQKERDLREDHEWAARTRQEYPNLPVEGERLGPALKRLYQGIASADDAGLIGEILKAANEALVGKVDLTKTIGSDRTATAQTDYDELIGATAKRISAEQKKAGKPINMYKARALAMREHKAEFAKMRGR